MKEAIKKMDGVMRKHAFCRLLIVGATAALGHTMDGGYGWAGDTTYAKRAVAATACDTRVAASAAIGTCVRISGHVRTETSAAKAGARAGDAMAANPPRLPTRQNDDLGFKMHGMADLLSPVQEIGGTRLYLRPKSDSRDLH